MSDNTESAVMDFLGGVKNKEPNKESPNNANGDISSQAFDLFSKNFNQKGTSNMASEEQRQSSDEKLGGDGFSSWLKAMGGATQLSVPRLDLSFNNSKDAVFRHHGGFGSPIPVPAGFEHRKWDPEGVARQQSLYNGFPVFRPAVLACPSTQSGGAQLTIFYGGTVNVYDNIPADKAQAIMLLASSGIATCRKPAQNSGNSVGSGSEGEKKISPFQSPNHPSRKVQADLPIARKHSLQRFLEKRKDRINSKAPYSINAEESFTKGEENGMAKEKEITMACQTVN